MKLLKINHPSKFTLTEKLVVKIKAVSLSDDGKTLEILSGKCKKTLFFRTWMNCSRIDFMLCFAICVKRSNTASIQPRSRQRP